ncbi:major facilitator superfamily transporter [Mycena olivaceomarginata]|nr:major facilitator superfamily transporter [Mycena olivaceomarginata]
MQNDVNEETALLSRPERKRTPLPKLQLSVIMLIQICEPIASQSIYPYINQTCRIAVESKVAPFSGLRKPILMIGLFGTGTSILCFGLSRTFGALIVSRCLCGLLNGNIGVMKSTMGDLTDRSNRAEGFAYLPSICGPLDWRESRPAPRPFPSNIFGQILARIPVLPPLFGDRELCLFLVLLGVGVIQRGKLNMRCYTVPAQKKPLVLAEGGFDDILHADGPRKRNGPRPLRELLIPSVITSVSNYVALGFLNTTLQALLPLFLAMPIEIGGLGLPPKSIGLILGAYGLTTGLFQVVFFARMIHRFRRVFINGMITCLPVFALFPIISIVARHCGLSLVVYCLVGCILGLGALMDTSFGAIFMFITASAPKSSRGSVHGLSQTSVALARAIGPALSTSLFSLSVQHNLLSGYMVYLFFFVLSGFALVLAGRLPEEVWDDVDD